MKKSGKTSFMVNMSLFDGLEEEYEEKWECLAEDSTMDPRSIAAAKALYDQEMSFRKWLVKTALNQSYGKIHTPTEAGLYGKFGASKPPLKRTNFSDRQLILMRQARRSKEFSVIYSEVADCRRLERRGFLKAAGLRQGLLSFQITDAGKKALKRT